MLTGILEIQPIPEPNPAGFCLILARLGEIGAAIWFAGNGSRAVHSRLW